MFFLIYTVGKLSEKRCKCTQKKCNEQIFLTFFLQK